MLPIQHNNKKKKNALYNKNAGPFIVIFTTLMPTCCVILEYFVFDVELQGFDYFLETSTLFFIYIMAMWSYYQAITIDNDTLPKQPPSMDTRDIDPVYKNTASCLDCNRWKPIRAHHCSMCGKCVSKMDHHCPWINNCVGLRNHRAFYLFTLYMTLGGIQYSWRSWVYFNKLYFSDNFFSESTTFYIFWGFTSIILYPTALMLSFLFFYHSLLMITNQTTLEQMRSAGQQGCFPKHYDVPKYINVYDRGWIANVAWFFNYSWLWWMPFENIYENDGTTYPISPLCTFQEATSLDPSLGDKIPQNHQFDLSEINEKYLEYLETAKEKYRGKRIIVNDQVIMIE